MSCLSDRARLAPLCLEVRAAGIIGRRVHLLTARTLVYVAAAPVHRTAVYMAAPGELAEVRWVTLAEAGELLPGVFGPVCGYLERAPG